MGEESSLPRGWCNTSLEKIANWGSGGTPSRNVERYFQGTIPWVKTGELGAMYIRDTSECITDEAIKNSSAKIFPKGSVGIAMYGATIGKLSIWGVDASTNQACAVGIPTEAIGNEFLYYFLLAEKRNFIKAGKGGAQPNISQGIIKEWPIDLPPLSEQHRIVAKIEELFSELDKGIENLNTARAQLKVYRQALLKHAFEGKLTAQWRADNRGKLETAEALQKRIQLERMQRHLHQLAYWEAAGRQGSKPKAPKPLPPLATEELTELPALPKGWIYTSVGSLIDDPTYGTSKKCDYEVDGIGVLRIPNVISGRVDASDLKFAQFTADEIATYKLKVGDILIIRSNGSVSIVGRCALVSGADVNYLYAGYLIRLRPHQRLVLPEYLLNTFSLHAVRKQVEAKAKSSSGVNNINIGEIQSLVVALCGIEEQEQIQMEIEFRLSNVDQLDQTITTALQQAEALRQSILKKAFSGQLVPQDPHDEPASTLLARIKAEKAAQPKKKKVRT